MSKLAEQIKTIITNERVRSNYTDYSYSRVTLSDIPKNDLKVRFTATFGIEAYIREELAHDKEILALTLKDVRHRVVEEVFGEFRQPLHNIVAQLYRREYERVLESVHELEKQMFNV